MGEFAGHIKIHLKTFLDGCRKSESSNSQRAFVFSPYNGSIFLIEPRKTLGDEGLIYPWVCTPKYDDKLNYVGIGAEERWRGRWIDQPPDVKALENLVDRFWVVLLVPDTEEEDVAMVM
jgi:hypothetical protein